MLLPVLLVKSLKIQILPIILISLPLRFGWNPVLRNRKVVMNHVKPVIDKRLREKNVLGDLIIGPSRSKEIRID